MKRIAFAILLASGIGTAQEKPADPKAEQESRNLTREANKELAGNDFVRAEADFRRAIAKSGDNSVAPYNLGTAYYRKDSYGEAFGRFKEAAEKASEKPHKQRAFHNMGNVYMKRKEYEPAVEAYKEALRNNPGDEETRYNLALAKELLEKEKQEQQQNQDQDDQNEQQDDQQEQEKNQNQQDQGENGDQEEQQDQQQDGDSEQEDNQEGDGDKKEEQDRKPQDQQQQPRPNQLSPQQIQNLLQAMENEEKKVKEKLDAQKVKGIPARKEKDW